jgi:hypothetical protein
MNVEEQRGASGATGLYRRRRTRAVASLFISVSLSPAGKLAGFNLKGAPPHTP